MYRGRFAPSPSGPLHFGSLVAAVASYADALRAGGEWLIRIEDVDEARSEPGATEDIVSTLALYGFPTGGDIAVQSQRTAHYARALDTLRARGLLFPCTCSRSRLESAPVGPLGERVYPGYCRSRPADDIPGSAFAWRVRVDHTEIAFVDRVQGAQRQRLARDVGDFVVRRADGFFAYQLAVVVDDAEQRISAVVRGADLLASTPRQMLLQRLFGYPAPSYLHVPVVLNGEGSKLSKQSRAPALPLEDPVRALLAAWRFLDQVPPARTPGSVTSFWAFAAERWQPGRVPPVPMLPTNA